MDIFTRTKVIIEAGNNNLYCLLEIKRSVNLYDNNNMQVNS